MKKIFTLFFLTTAVVSYAQEGTYEIVNNQAGVELEEYHLAMSNSDFNVFRLRNGRRELTFQNGIVIELKSVTELIQAGIPVDGTKCLKNGVPKGYVEPIYNLVNGNIIANYSKQNKK